MFTFLCACVYHPCRRSSGGWGWQGLLTLLLLLVSAAALAEKTVTTTYYYTDVLGSVVATADAQGTVRSRRTYQPYGAIHAPDPTDTEALGYTGKPLDASGLQYFGARYFDPRLGRFMGIDPVGFDPAQPFSFNRYAYANNNPYRYVDPDGKSPIALELGKAGALGGTFACGPVCGAVGGVIGAGIGWWGTIELINVLSENTSADGSGEDTEETEAAKNAGKYRPDNVIPQDKNGEAVPDTDVPHTQLGTEKGRKGDYTKAREWIYGKDGNLQKNRDIDFTDHGRPKQHPNPHQHKWLPNPTGGSLQHGPAEPLEYP